MIFYGLIWSKIVQILTTKSSRWARHYQVSWSGFFVIFDSHGSLGSNETPNTVLLFDGSRNTLLSACCLGVARALAIATSGEYYRSRSISFSYDKRLSLVNSSMNVLFILVARE